MKNVGGICLTTGRECGKIQHGGHLIATIFNGDGNLANLVPMNRNLNRSALESMEADWARLLLGYDVEVKIEVFYDDLI